MSSEPVYIGFANLPNQVHRKTVKKGIEFNLMVVGESGLGKSTLINSLFNVNLYQNRKIPLVHEQLEQTLKITTNTVDIDEKGVKLKMTVIDTPGYGDALDCTNEFEPIIKYVDDQYERYFQHETSVVRKQTTDSRVHCCLYFISPNSYGLKTEDITFMKKLHTKVNIIPVIGKSDFLTKEECKSMKKRILDDIKVNGIKIWSIPDPDSEDDDDYKELIKDLKASVPFAVCGSTDLYDIRGKKQLARQYQWGMVEVENPEHCDFSKLRTLFVTHVQDLREVTKEVHYENYRTQRLARKSDKDNVSVASFNVQDETEKDRLLQEKEAELRKMQEALERIKQQMLSQQQQHGKQENDLKTNGSHQPNGN